jgi:hypothetical protein
VLGGILLAEGCAPWFRCKAGHPLGWGDASTQAEPLCTDAELRSVVDAELARRPQDLFTDRGSSARPGLPAFVFLDEQRDDDLTPVAFHMAHQRRRYAFRDAPAEAPSCDARPALGTPCRCSEAAVRAQACRATLTASTVLLPTAQTGLCRFAIDDGALTLGPVVAAGGMASP